MGPGVAFQIACTSECDFKGCFFMLFLLSCCENITLGYSTPGKGSIFCIVYGFWFAECDVYGCGIVVRNCQCRRREQSQHRRQWFHRCTVAAFFFFASCLFPPPSLILFSAFHFLHKGKMRKNKTNIWKLKHDREGREGRRNRGRRGNLRKQEGFQK